MNIKHWISLALLSSTLVACGGGGASSNSAGNNGMVNAASRAENSGLTLYTDSAGAINEAVLTALNQNDFVRLLVNSTWESDYIGIAFRSGSDSDADNDATANSAAIVHNDLLDIAEDYWSAKQRTQQARALNVSGRCTKGSLTLSGELNDSTGAGFLDVTYNDCQVGNTIKRGNGRITVNKIDASYARLTDYIIEYKELSVVTVNRLYLYTGTQHAIRTLTNGILTKYVITSDLHRLDQTHNRISVDNTVNTGTASGQQLSGQLCDGPYGCVRLTTRIPFRGSEGELTMEGVINSKIQVYIAGGRLTSRVDEGNGRYGPPTTFVY